MKSLVLSALALLPLVSHASEFDRREAWRRDLSRQQERANYEAEQAVRNQKIAAALAESLHLPPGSVRQTGQVEWMSNDGRFVCQMKSGGMGLGAWVPCLDENGRYADGGLGSRQLSEIYYGKSRR